MGDSGIENGSGDVSTSLANDDGISISSDISIMFRRAVVVVVGIGGMLSIISISGSMSSPLSFAVVVVVTVAVGSTAYAPPVSKYNCTARSTLFSATFFVFLSSALYIDGWRWGSVPASTPVRRAVLRGLWRGIV